jgi:hypothetical protein
MKYEIKTHSWKALIVVAIFSLFSGCGEMLENPTIDKDTGEDINFIIIDFNVFDTRASYRLIDVSDNSEILTPAKIWFTGANANDIVDYAGKKNDEYHTPQGQLELTFDPNVPVSSSSPLEFAVHVEAEGYHSLSQGIQINSEGKKTFELFLSKESDEEETILTGGESPDDDTFIFSFAQSTKSVVVAEKLYQMSYAISKNDVVKFKDFYGEQIFASIDELNEALKNNPSGFLKLTIEKSSNYPATTDAININGKPQTVSFQKLETGVIKGIRVNGRIVSDLNGGVIHSIANYTENPVPDVFGFVKFKNNSWTIQGTSIEHTTLNSSYTLASASLTPLCATGSVIRFTSNIISSFSIDADFYDEAGKKLMSNTFSGNFPETFTLENVPSQSAKIVFRNNNPSFKPIADLDIANLCSGSYEVEVSPENEVAEYQIVFKALCADNPSIGIAPSYSGQIKIKDSTDNWQGIEMIGGIANITAKPNKEYLLRLLWEDEWEVSTFSTEFDADGNYTGKTNSKISSEKLEDGRIRIKIEHLFNQSVCDSMNW